MVCLPTRLSGLLPSQTSHFHRTDHYPRRPTLATYRFECSFPPWHSQLRFQQFPLNSIPNSHSTALLSDATSLYGFHYPTLRPVTFSLPLNDPSSSFPV